MSLLTMLLQLTKHKLQLDVVFSMNLTTAITTIANIFSLEGQRCWRLHGDPHVWRLLRSCHLMDALSAKSRPEQSSAGLRLPLRCLCYDW